MSNLGTSIYESLKRGTENVESALGKYNALEEKIQSGKYSAEYVKDNLAQEEIALKEEIRKAKENALVNAKELVDVYEEEMRAKDDLRAKDITEDAKLFSLGVKLTARDVEAIIDRNKDNATMTQLAYRYAEENGIAVNRPIYIGHYQQKRQEIEGLRSTIDYYAKWIDQKNAQDVLKKFFYVTE